MSLLPASGYRHTLTALVTASLAILSLLRGDILSAQERKNTPTKPQTDAKKQDQSKPPEKKPPEKKTAEKKPADAEKQEDADAQTPAGHSYHGEVFNEGPRQKAVLMGGTGNVHLPVTTKSKQAQKFFDQGLGQLHGFWYLEAERSFRQAAALDPDCPMAYWGAAMANRSNSKRSKGFMAEAKKRIAKASPREKMYIDALDAYIKADPKKRKERNQAYTKALENLILAHPDELEAKALLALHLYGSRDSSTSYFAVNALIEDILEVEPLHPVHHFRIHLWDYRKPERALSSAARCGQSAPAIAHMWHMPGHIYSRLKRYRDAVWQQEASARVDHAQMMRYGVMPDQIHNFAHNNEWLIRNMIYIGRAADAVDLAKNMTELPRHPRYNTLKRRGSAYYGRLRLFQVLRSFEMWDEMIALADTPYLMPTDDADQQVKRLRYLGLAYFRVGNMESGEAQLAELQKRLDSQKAAKEKAEQTARDKAIKAKKDKKQTDKAVAAAGKPFATKVRNLEGNVNALKGHRHAARKEYKEAYELLKKAGGVDPLHLAQAQWHAGQRDQAIEAVRKQVTSSNNQVLPLAALVELLAFSDKKEEAGKAFDQLREISSEIDLSAPPFARLETIARDLGHDKDWRIAAADSKDVGKRPTLDSLGPFRWSPSPSPAWTLPDAAGNDQSSKQFQGKPHVLIFYLGYQCLHCAEQLEAFAPMADEFKKAGIEMLAISTDDVDGLKISIENYDKEKPAKDRRQMTIPLVADPKMDVFKAFRAYDDFENQPLHGTYIIDASGRILWQDISYEPFMDPKFVLKEAQRLLAQ